MKKILLIVIAISIITSLGACNNKENKSINAAKDEVIVDNQKDSEVTDEKKNDLENSQATETTGNKEDTIEEDEYLLSFSSHRKITYQEIYDLSCKYSSLVTRGIDLAKNEIFARHGYVFKQKKYKDYFSQKSWYKPRENMDVEELSELEWYNINFLRFFEMRYGLLETEVSSTENNDNTNEQNKLYKVYEADEIVYCDLNGDGKDEKILYTKVQDEYNEYYLSVNDKKVKTPGGDGFETFAIMDLDQNDNFTEIIVSDFGPSYDLTSAFYRYDGEIIQIGNTQGAFGDMIFSGDGMFVTNTRGRILHTWFYKDTFILDNNTIRNIPQELYYMGIDVFVLKSLTLFKNRDKSEKGITLREGEIVNISVTDNYKWCLVERENGEKGWFYLEDNWYINDTGCFPAEYFYGLCFAD